MRRTFYFWCMALVLTGAVRAQHQPKAYRLPSSASTPVFEIVDRSRIQVEQIQDDWAQVVYGARKGWVAVSELLVFPDPRVEWKAPPLTVSEPVVAFDPIGGTGVLEGLVAFATGEERSLARVTDPVARQKIRETNREWGRLFVFKTPLYRAQGLRLYRFPYRSWSLNVAQGRARSRDGFGQALSDSLEDQVLKSNRGVLGNRTLFRRGRSYLLELRYDF